MPDTVKELRSETVAYTVGDTECDGYLVVPAGADGPLPCVLLAHDWSGLNEPIREIARRVAGLGYAAFALDLYGRGVRGEPTGDNSALMAPLVGDRALLLERLMGGLEVAASRPEVDPRNLAAMGYCFGGLCALDLARAAPEGLKAAISFHGVFAPPNLGPQGKISARILVLHGWSDPLAPPDDVVALARELTEAGADWQLHAYGHAMHAFTFEGAAKPEMGVAYDAAADRRSWAAMRAHLEEVFG